LSVARKQMVEIARALAFEARIIVMDEPTSSLTEREVFVLLELVKKLRERGVAILYTSHRLDEVFEITDRITVLRDGGLVGVRRTAESSATEIVSMMVGRAVDDLYGEPGARTLGDEVLAVQGLSTVGRLQDVSFGVRAGEIVGFAGLIGAGRTEVARAVFGADGKGGGTVALLGRPVQITSPRGAIEAGIGYLPEERKLQSLFLGLSVRSNATVSSLDRIGRHGFVDGARERALAQDLVRQFGVKTPTLDQEIRHLSGGNQQKVVIARWLAVSPKVLFLDEPTRGVDVGAKAEIYALMREMARRGMAIVMISSELPEVLGMSDRVIVLRGGRVAGELPRAQATEEAVMHLATGVSARAGVAS
jgi:ribose transport system ATP-binding protein